MKAADAEIAYRLAHTKAELRGGLGRRGSYCDFQATLATKKRDQKLATHASGHFLFGP
jgi:hypothetical protein